MTKKHDGKCPCGCKRDVPHGCFYATPHCGRVYRREAAKSGRNTAPVWTGRTLLVWKKRVTKQARATIAALG